MKLKDVSSALRACIAIYEAENEYYLARISPSFSVSEAIATGKIPVIYKGYEEEAWVPFTQILIFRKTKQQWFKIVPSPAVKKVEEFYGMPSSIEASLESGASTPEPIFSNEYKEQRYNGNKEEKISVLEKQVAELRTRVSELTLALRSIVGTARKAGVKLDAASI
mmetsp:Transcript_41087/g.66786  ORF Transcript_41087/g.66786 Transcript_41087/m.66786 type:complete len:166 (-) Transcript_41087:91-588(-)